MSVQICEVAPRDGLQNEPTILPPAVRAQLVERLAATGVPRIEATSFVNPARVPAMAEAEAVVAAIDRRPGTSYAGLVLNERGYARLRQTALDEVRIAVACSERFSQRNCGCSVEQGIAAATSIAGRARADGRRVSITLMVAFGCPYEGRVPEVAVLRLAERALKTAPDELMLADTIGTGVPEQVGPLVREVAKSRSAVGVHLHDTRGAGLGNALAALESGATVLDAAVGGFGGCPFAPGAPGNVASEQLVHRLVREGIDTGIDLDELVRVGEWLAALLNQPREEQPCATA